MRILTVSTDGINPLRWVADRDYSVTLGLGYAGNGVWSTDPQLTYESWTTGITGNQLTDELRLGVYFGAVPAGVIIPSGTELYFKGASGNTTVGQIFLAELSATIA